MLWETGEYWAVTVWMPMSALITKASGEPTIAVKVADYASGTDVPASEDADLFSIWF